ERGLYRALCEGAFFRYYDRREFSLYLMKKMYFEANDRIVNRTVSRAPALYTGEFAVRDTAEEIRRVRGAGVAVLGVFAGEEADLEAEKKIFGRDFAYIRDIRHFSPTVGRYLRRQLDLV
ncbi:MAG: hypothetical protein LUC27_04025, partial [Lachnospiraceae bacterium]|nr:hypothetical protein [Lachnospiraceae bacterium]